MKKKYYKAINYQHLFFEVVKEKYFNLVLGMLVSYLFVSIIVKLIPKNFYLSLIRPGKTNQVSPTQKAIKTYLVQEGDDLWKIAEKFYGSGFNAYDISVANKIDPATPIETGQKLIIPNVKRGDPTVGEISSASTFQVSYAGDKYIVLPGDSLSIISQKVYGDLYAWPRILQANNLLNADQIEVGMVLIIPR